MHIPLCKKSMVIVLTCSTLASAPLAIDHDPLACNINAIHHQNDLFDEPITVGQAIGTITHHMQYIMTPHTTVYQKGRSVFGIIVTILQVAFKYFCKTGTSPHLTAQDYQKALADIASIAHAWHTSSRTITRHKSIQYGATLMPIDTLSYDIFCCIHSIFCVIKHHRLTPLAEQYIHQFLCAAHKIANTLTTNPNQLDQLLHPTEDQSDNECALYTAVINAINWHIALMPYDTVV